MISPIPPIRLRFARIRTTPHSRRSPLSIPCLASHNRAGNRAQRPCGSSPRRRYFIDEIRRRLCSDSSSPANPISSELPSPAAPPPANLAPPRERIKPSTPSLPGANHRHPSLHPYTVIA
uniref:Uncharacterized protein n=1 Tax=Triticum urartu TaxID=4572 RepID=A0A8R7P1C2_TRIUA